MKFLFLLLVSATVFASPSPAPVALIYKGPGSCSKEQGDAGINGAGCSEAARVIAIRAGYQPVYVGPDALTPQSTAVQVKALFKNARVWIQPGGESNTAYEAMNPRLITELKKFISLGGGYVGWCAGAFIATAWIGSTGEGGLGIFPGSTDLYESPTTNAFGYSFEKLNWQGKHRSVYFEGGAYLTDLEKVKGVQTVATYPNGLIAAARTTYHRGHVYITGAHPEAPAIWSEENKIHDPDGMDHDLAAQMVKWAAAKFRIY